MRVKCINEKDPLARIQYEYSYRIAETTWRAFIHNEIVSPKATYLYNLNRLEYHDNLMTEK